MSQFRCRLWHGHWQSLAATVARMRLVSAQPGLDEEGPGSGAGSWRRSDGVGSLRAMLKAWHQLGISLNVACYFAHEK
jgi:hypothetical protein